MGRSQSKRSNRKNTIKDYGNIPAPKPITEDKREVTTKSK